MCSDLVCGGGEGERDRVSVRGVGRGAHDNKQMGNEKKKNKMKRRDSVKEKVMGVAR